ncbi:MAG: CCA tRNA nucleotidyltransferase [Candidatus Omnitrophica bacterium]|nr:CCA tRNA nucleotidyltransferase [Candidatus Omnitrophota bacterium]
MRRVSEAKKLALGIVQSLAKADFLAYFAGGCVRDLIMRNTPKDYDIATTAKPEDIERIFPRCVPVGKQFGVMIVIQDDRQFEVATFRREGPYLDGRHPEGVSFTTPEEDANRRDFTVNGLFYDPLKRKTIDYVGGRDDIRRKLIRTIGKPQERFQEDRLRLLRAIRFAANLGFAIEARTWAAIQELGGEIHLVSQERVRDELVKMFTRPNAGRGLELLSECGLLKEILPEIENMKGVKQPPEFHPEGDVFIHTKMLMDRLENPSLALAFGALFHDVGKPDTFSDEGKRIHFYNHPKVGAEMTRNIMTRLRFSNREITEVVSCVENHMKFANVREMRLGKLKQFVARDNFPTELELHRIDCLASHGQLDLFEFLKGKVKVFKEEELKPRRFLTGDDLIALGIKPGPVMKEILEEAYTLQLEGKMESHAQALDWARNRFLK